MLDATVQSLLIITGSILVAYAMNGQVVLPGSKGDRLTRNRVIGFYIFGFILFFSGIFLFMDERYSLITKEVVPAQGSKIEPYIVYSDNHFSSGNIWDWSGADIGMEPHEWVHEEIKTPDHPKGKKYYGVKSGLGDDNYVGWGIYLGLFIGDWRIKTSTVDLNYYDHLEFMVRTPVDLTVMVDYWDYNEEKDYKSSEVKISDYGWDRNKSDEWQKVIIPKSNFGYLDWANVCAPFIIGGTGSEISFFVHEVVWISGN